MIRISVAVLLLFCSLAFAANTPPKIAPEKEKPETLLRVLTQYPNCSITINGGLLTYPGDLMLDSKFVYMGTIICSLSQTTTISTTASSLKNSEVVLEMWKFVEKNGLFKYTPTEYRQSLKPPTRNRNSNSIRRIPL